MDLVLPMRLIFLDELLFHFITPIPLNVSLLRSSLTYFKVFIYYKWICKVSFQVGVWVIKSGYSMRFSKVLSLSACKKYIYLYLHTYSRSTAYVIVKVVVGEK